MQEDWESVIYPDLKRIDKTQRAKALQQAKEGAFDAVELVGIGLALLLSVSLTRYAATGLGLVEHFGAILGNFLVAVPLLLVFAGPFYVRRTRRGLRSYLQHRQAQEDDRAPRG